MHRFYKALIFAEQLINLHLYKFCDFEKSIYPIIFIIYHIL